MRFTPQLRALDWLVAKPIAHRGLHAEAEGVVENCESAFEAAIEHGFAIECDIQLTKDGEAMVFHDDAVDRLLDGAGAVKDFTADQLMRMKFKLGRDRVQTLGDLLDQVDGSSTLIIEIKSLWDNDFSLTDRALDLLSYYDGPFALMSFDPALIARVADKAPDVVRGITADRVVDPYYNPLPVSKRLAMRSFSHLPKTRPHFISFDFTELPFQPITEFRNAGHPIISWTIKNETQAAQARRYSDQITFEKFVPA